MKYSTLALLAICACMSTLAALNAHAREISCMEAMPAPWEQSKTQERTTCNVNEVFSELDHVVVLAEDPMILVSLPNLLIPAISWDHVGPEVIRPGDDTEYVVSFDVVNDGRITASGPRLVVLIIATHPTTGYVTTIERSLTGLLDIPAGGSVPFEARFRLEWGVGFLVRVIAIADPGTIIRPGGDIVELLETDNEQTLTFTSHRPR